MAQLQRLEAEIAALPDHELRRLRSWFDAFDAKRWDCEIASDSVDGKLEALVAEALVDYDSKKCKPI
jgi:hypothetical protein